MFGRKIFKYLREWKSKSHRKPLVLRGARQVGKTSAVRMFAASDFSDLVELNLDNVEHLRLFSDVETLNDFFRVLEIVMGRRVTPGKTLIFIDEIQNAPPLIRLLRFFYEQRPELHVIAAGSLLEARIAREGLSFPVGRVEFMYMYPLDFFEFVLALGKKEMHEFLTGMRPGDSVPQGLHDEAMRLFDCYALIGGMPEIVARYAEGVNVEQLKVLYSSLLTAYYDDMYKYASHAQAKYLSFVMDQAPLHAGTTIVYDKFGGSSFRSREMGQAFDLLEKVMLVFQLRASKSMALPLVPQEKRAKKLIFLDVGLMNYRAGIQPEGVSLRNTDDGYRGRLAEQIVGQHLFSSCTLECPDVLYWSRDKAEGAAEVDFCFVEGGHIIGIEVKSGSGSNLRSLLSFGGQVKDNRLVRVYNGRFCREQVTREGKTFHVLSMPFYCLPRIRKIAAEAGGKE